MTIYPSIIPSDVAQRIESWLTGPYDDATKAEIRQQLQENPEDLIDAFFTDLSFGTGGLRGLMGVGTNRLNRYTIQLTTQGLANYLLQQKTSPAVLIGFDSRHHSRAFAETAAEVLAGNGITVYYLPELRPTPYVSFGCRHYHCDAAIMITASHNPKEYNGYKVYGSDGAQVVHPHDTAIMNEVKQIRSLSQVKPSSLNHPLIKPVDLIACDRAYLQAIEPLQHFPSDNQKYGALLPITYTSLHGTGITIVPQALASWGFTSIHLVPKQTEPNGDFPTVALPNPEYPETLRRGLHTLQDTGSTLLIANDPDADRLGVACLHHGKPFIFNGNQIAALCVDYLCEVFAPKRLSQGTFVTTIVTTELIKAIALAHQFDCVEVLTGFKYIGEKIHLWESTSHTFLFGAEESYGYLLGTAARDKDGIVTACLIAEIALHAQRAQETLVDRLYRLYKRYGLYQERQASVAFKPGKAGMEEMAAFMYRLRHPLPKQLCGQPVIEAIDYLMSDVTGLPESDVLSFRLQDQSRLIIRPSGTEPKIKIYASTRLPSFTDIDTGLALCNQKLDTLLSPWQSHDS